MADEITGRDLWIITEALATAVVALEQLPAERQPDRQYGGHEEASGSCG